MALYAIAGAALILYMTSKKENYKFTLPTDDVQVSVDVSPEDLSRILQVTKNALEKKIGSPTYPLETTYIRQTGDTYNCRFMFTVLGGYPYGLAVDSDVKGGEVVDLRLQEDGGSTVDGFGNTFVRGSEFVQEFPTIAQLRSVM